jgi:type I restriction-modification system DNA methylase subunit
MSIEQFVETITTLLQRARQMLAEGEGRGQPEESTKDKLLEPFLEALGYGPDYRTREGNIKSLVGTNTWVDYFLLPDRQKAPTLMIEAKSLWESDLWSNYGSTVLRYLRDYHLMVGPDEPVLWILLTNFREWHLLRLNDRTPFWSFTTQDFARPEFAGQVYERLAREHLPRERLQEFYTERQREDLQAAHFLADLKTWRVILANGIYKADASLPLAQIKEASQLILNRFLLVRLLEAYGNELFYSLGQLYNFWERSFKNKPFFDLLKEKFHDTWVSYNTELFAESWVDQLHIPTDYLEPLILPDAIPTLSVAACLDGQLFGYRSIYNYDFTTLTQDVLGMAYEQFLAHELQHDGKFIRILENQQTRKREGVYYTPSYIVQRIVHQTLVPKIRPKVERAIKLLEAGQYSQARNEVLSVLEYKILDPACGSGSFLLAAFDYITQELGRYNEAIKRVEKQQQGNLLTPLNGYRIPMLEEQVLVRMLYGVDLDPQAVLLAKLSLWTRLLRVRPNYYGEKGKHLPALTLNIRVGNSLIDAAADLTSVRSELEQAADYARAAKDVTRPETERLEAVAHLENLISQINKKIDLNLVGFFASDESISSVVRSLNREPDARTLEAVRVYLTEGRKPSALRDWSDAELSRLRSELMVLETARQEVIVKRPFNWAVEFPDVFDPRLERQGFDVVLGNPPYYNVDATFGRGAPELRWLAVAYPEIYTDKTDILFYFIRRAFQLLVSGGDLSFIVSRAFIQGDKACNLRHFLTEKTTLLYILDFLGHKVFKAGIVTCILHARNAVPPAGHKLIVDNVLDFEQVREVLENPDPLAPFSAEAVTRVEIAQAELGEERWSLSPYREIFERIDRAGPKLKESKLGRFLKGIDTGLDRVFEGNFAGRFPSDWLKARVPISHIHKFGWEPGETQILYITHTTDWEKIPPEIQKYLRSHKKELEERDVYQHPATHYEWFHLHCPREGLFVPKIFFPRRAPENRFAVDETGEIGFKSDCAAFLKNLDDRHDLYYLCSLLNSKVLEFRYRALGGLGKLTGRGMFEYFENQVGDLPIPTFEDPQNHPDHQRLAQLGREAHQLFKERFKVITTFETTSRSLSQYEIVPFWHYHNPGGNYQALVARESPDPNREGHLLALRIKPTEDGYHIWGEITEDEDWREGEREWILLSRVSISDPALRRYLLARALYLTEFDEAFRRKQKFTERISNLVTAALKALTGVCYDEDSARNLKIFETLEQRVASTAGRVDIEAILLRQQSVEEEINEIAYRLYGVERYKSVIEEALRVVL